MSGLQWFRLYADAVDDEKLRLLAYEDRWHFVALLCLKANGTLDSGSPFIERRIAVKLGVQLRELDEIKRRLEEVALIDASFQPLAWSRRQYQSDHSAERVKRWRERTKTGNGLVTLQKRRRNTPEQSRAEQNRTDKTHVLPDDVEGLNTDAFRIWTAYRIEIKKPLKTASLTAAARKLAKYGADQAAVVEQSVAQGWVGLFPVGRGAAEKSRGFQA